MAPLSERGTPGTCPHHSGDEISQVRVLSGFLIPPTGLRAGWVGKAKTRENRSGAGF